jgi:RHS repeat-associated protein
MSGGITVDYQYDSSNRLIQVSDTKSMVDIDFAYDNAGRLTGMTRTPGVDASFAYDTAGRLVHINEAAMMDLQYTLTPAGEVASVSYSAPLIPSVTASTQSFLFGKAGQITTPGYTYDARGRLTAAPAGVTYAWDAAARLINANGVTLAYNGLGDVTTRADGSGVTRFYNHYALGMAPIVYEDPPAGSDRAYVWTPEGSLLYSVDMGTGAPTFYHFDRTGSTLALTDATDMVTDSYAYGPYGEPMGHTGASTQPFQYIGAYGVRAEGSLYQMRARYYDPKTARFISRDPSGPRLGDAKSVNPYVYASQNPMRYIDPAGNYSQPINRFFIHSGYGYPSHSGWTVLHRRHRWGRSRWPCAAGGHWGSPTWSDLAPPTPCGGDIFGRPLGYGGTCANDFLGGYPFHSGPGFPSSPFGGFSCPGNPGGPIVKDNLWFFGSNFPHHTNRWGDYSSLPIDPFTNYPFVEIPAGPPGGCLPGSAPTYANTPTMPPDRGTVPSASPTKVMGTGAAAVNATAPKIITPGRHKAALDALVGRTANSDPNNVLDLGAATARGQ